MLGYIILCWPQDVRDVKIIDVDSYSHPAVYNNPDIGRIKLLDRKRLAIFRLNKRKIYASTAMVYVLGNSPWVNDTVVDHRGDILSV